MKTPPAAPAAPASPAARGDRPFRAVCLILLACGLLSAGVFALNALSRSNVSYPAWTTEVTYYLSEALTAVRLAISLAAVVHAFYFVPKPGKWLGLAVGFAFFAYFAAYLTVVWLFSESAAYLLLALFDFLPDAVILVLAAVLAFLMAKRYRAADSEGRRRKTSPGRALLWCLVLSAAIHLLLYVCLSTDVAAMLLAGERFYPEEVSVIVGNLLERIVFFAGLGSLAAYPTLAVLERHKGA